MGADSGAQANDLMLLIEELRREAERVSPNQSGIPTHILLYAGASSFRVGSTYMIVGYNPGGSIDDAIRQWPSNRRAYDGEAYSSYLDCEWGRGRAGGHYLAGAHPLQLAIQGIFMLLTGSSLESAVAATDAEGRPGRLTSSAVQLIRGTPSTNLIPFPSAEPRALDPYLAREGRRIGWRLITAVKPRVLFAIGNNESDSVWSAVASGASRGRPVSVYGTYTCKQALVESGPLKGTLVIGLPHLSRLKSRAKLYEAVRRMLPAIHEHA